MFSANNPALFNTGATPNILHINVVQLGGDGFGLDYKATISFDLPDQCQSDLATCQLNNAQLQTQVNTLTSQNTQLQQQVQTLQSQLTQLITTLVSDLTDLQDDLRVVFNDPNFVIPGATPLKQYQNLITAILKLNKGRKMGIYTNLGGKP